MKLIEFSVKNYRSITNAYKITLSDYAVLVGPNNEGKSNVLRALGLGLSLLSKGRAVAAPGRNRARFAYRDVERFSYDWERDYPVSLQDNGSTDGTTLSFTFSLTPADYDAFYSTVGSRLQTNLRIRLVLGPNDATFDVVISGPSKQILQKRQAHIAQFIGERIFVQYIPASRSVDMAHDAANDLIQNELASLESTEEYQALIRDIERLQKPIRDRVSAAISSTMANFIPNLRSVDLVPDSHQVRHSLRSAHRLIIDDGARTDLLYKGDGIKSLAALSLIRHTTNATLAGRHLILAVEEPETHLHPNAIHQLRQVLAEIAEAHQVIMTTHSPVLVDRVHATNNIIVESGTARKAKKLSDVRASLGVELSDNLTGAYLVLLVEGSDDATVLRKWISALSHKLRSALAMGTLIIEPLDGASKLPFKASMYRSILCNVFAFIDNDAEGQQAASTAVSRNHISNADYILSVCNDMRESEFEDLISIDTYKDAINQQFGVNLNLRSMRGTRQKWSTRIEREFTNAGKLWRAEEKAAVKKLVSKQADLLGLASLDENRRAVVDRLITTLEEQIDRRE